MRDANLRKGDDGRYYLRVPVANSNRRKWISTNERDIKSARRAVKISGADRLIQLHNARCLTAETIAMVTLGRNVTSEEIFTLWLEWVQPRLAPSSFVKYEHSIRLFLEHHGANKKPLNCIREEDCNAWINDGVSPRSTREGRLTALRLFFKWTNAKGLIVGNPVALVEINFREMTVEQIEGKHTPPMSEDDYQRIIADPRIKGFYHDATILAYCTGLRLCDCAALQWDSFTATEIVVYPLKTVRGAKRLAIPLSDPLIARPELLEVIARLLAVNPRADPTYVWPETQERVCQEGKSISSYYVWLIRRTGVQVGTFHGLRAAFSRRLDAAGRTLEQIAKAMGHSSIEQTSVYVGK